MSAQDDVRAAAQQVTELRRRDIKARLFTDIAHEFPLLSNETVDQIVDHAMFQIEHLLAEIEALMSQ